MAAPTRLVRCITIIMTSAVIVRTGDTVQHTPHVQSHQGSASYLGQTEKTNFEGGPSYFYHYQQHRGQPPQKIHVQYSQTENHQDQQQQLRNQAQSYQQPQQPRQTFSRWVAVPTRSVVEGNSPSRNLAYSQINRRPGRTETPPNVRPAVCPTSPPNGEYQADDSEERTNSSKKLYFEDHNGNDTHREHHYRHVTVNHFFYNATKNGTDGQKHTSTDSRAPQYHSSYEAPPHFKGKDVKHHYYYNEYKHDHRNNTPGNGDPNVKHHYYYNEYKHDHRNNTSGNDDPNVKHHYYYNELRNKTSADNSRIKYHPYKDYTDSKSPQYHSQHKEGDDNRSESDYEDSSTNEDSKEEDNANPTITEVYSKEDYEYVTPEKDDSGSTTTEKSVLKHHHHYYKEYHYKDGRLISNRTVPGPTRSRPYNVPESPPTPVSHPPYSPYGYGVLPPFLFPHSYHPYHPPNPGRFFGYPFIIKDPISYDQGYDGTHAYFGNPSYPGYSRSKPQNDASFRSKRPHSNGSLGYLLVDPLGRLPPLRIHASVVGAAFSDRSPRKVPALDNSYPETGTYRQTPKAQAHRIKLRHTSWPFSKSDDILPAVESFSGGSHFARSRESSSTEQSFVTSAF